MLFNDPVRHKRYLEAIRILFEVFKGHNLETGVVFGFNSTIALLNDRYLERAEKSKSASAALHLVKK